MFNFIWNLLTFNLRSALKKSKETITRLETQVKDLYLELSDLKNDNLKKDISIESLKKSLESQETMTDEESYWRSKWSHNPIRYKAQGEYYRDVRGLINYPSYIADEIVLFNDLKKDTEEETIMNLIKWVHKNIKYQSDMQTRQTVEFWEDSDIVLQKCEGDCEDLGICFKALSLACGIPDYKVKVLAGNVVDPLNKEKVTGHAYTVFLYKNKWRIIDPTYYPDWTTQIKDRMDASNDSRYKDVWFGFTKNDCFSQKVIDL